MTFHQHKKPSYVCISLNVALALLLVSGFLPGTVSATPAKPGLVQEDLKNHENTRNDNTTLIVSKSEAFKAQVKDYNLKSLLSGKSTDAFSDTMHLDALTKNLVKGKLDRNKQYIKKLQSGSSQNKQSIKRVRKVLTAAKTNPTRFNKLIATGNTSNSPVAHSKSGKQYIENQALAKLNKHSANERALAKARSSNSKIVASHGRYKKVQKTGGIVGRVLSLWDAGQNAYYYDTKTKTTRFDTGLYLKNAAMNLSGLSGIVGAYREGQKKGWLVGAYQGAKCIPLASDALNVYELTESSIGVVYDTLESNRIIAENKGEQKRQGQEAVAKLKKLFSQVKDKESEFKTLQKKSSDLRKHFADLNKQYITVFSRLVASEQNLTSSDALLKAAEKAKPFMDASRINALKTDSEKVLLATATTIKLANATRTHHQTAGDNPENLYRTVEELKQMVAMLSARKAECEEIQNAISPLLGGGEILEGAQKQNQQMAEDSQLSSQLYQQGRKLVQEHNDLIKKAKDLTTEQDTLLAQSKRLLSYYYRNGDPKTKTDLEIAFRNVVQYKIDDYSLGKLGEGQNAMAFTFRSWRKSTTTSDEIPPDVAVVIQEAITIAPEITELKESLEESISTTRKLLKRFSDPVEIAVNTPILKEKTSRQYLKNDELFNLSIWDIKKQVQFRERGGAIRKNADLYGYQAIRYSSTLGGLLSGIANRDTCAREIETGTTTIVDPTDGKKKKAKYTIWYVKDLGHISGWWPEYYQKQKQQETIEEKIKDYAVQSVNIENAEIAYIGKAKNQLHNIVRGFAVNPPFYVELYGWVAITVGDHFVFTSRDKDLYEKQYWDYVFFNLPQERVKLQARMKYWSSHLSREIAENLPYYMSVPAQMVKFTDKNFIKDVRPLFRGLDAFKKTGTQTSLSYERETRRLEKKWEWGDNIHASIRMSVDVSARFPWRQEDSWRTTLQKMHQRLQKRSEKYNSDGEVKKLALPGADLAYGYIHMHEGGKGGHYVSRGGRRISVAGYRGHINFIKKNVAVRIYFSASDLPPDKLIDPYQIAATILSNF